MKTPLLLAALVSFTLPALAADEVVLFDGKSLDAWEFAEGAWEIEEESSLVCRMKAFEADDGSITKRGMGYIWTKADYGDFELSLSYKLSEGANSGVFYSASPCGRASQQHALWLGVSRG
jgi:hypothetical protein